MGSNHVAADVRIEPLHPRYADALAGLVLASDSPDRLTLAAALRDFLWIDTFTLVAIAPGGLVGFLLGEVHGPDAVVTFLYVTPEERRRGTGSALVRAFAARTRLDGCQRVVVETSGDPSDGEGTDAFLRGLGLEPDGEPVDGRPRHVGDLLRAARPTRAT